MNYFIGQSFKGQGIRLMDENGVNIRIVFLYLKKLCRYSLQIIITQLHKNTHTHTHTQMCNKNTSPYRTDMDFFPKYQ